MRIVDYFQEPAKSDKPYVDILDLSKEINIELCKPQVNLNQQDTNKRSKNLTTLQDSDSGEINLPSLGNQFPQNIFRSGEKLKFDLIDIDHAFNNV